MPVPVPNEKDAKFLERARKRFQQAEDADKQQRTRELEDLKFYAGEQWPDDIKAQRAGQALNNNLPPVPARPTLTINQTREPVRQVLNQERQSDMGITLIPADDFGGLQAPIDPTEIKLREGLVRRIQRDSEAADARTWAFSRAAIAGRGYYGVMTRYVPGKTADQEIFIQRFYNQASVSLDPAHEQPDGSDAEWGFIGVDMPWDEYKAEFPTVSEKDNAICGADDTEFRALGDDYPGWFKAKDDLRSCRVVDYYYTVRESKELAMFANGQAEWLDAIPKDTPKDSYTTRTVVQKSIKWAKIDGCQVLDTTDWPGHWVPIIKVVGEELQPYDGERRCEGMVRPALDSCRSFNYMVSKWVEMIGLSPMPPWMLAAGQDEGFEEEYKYANTRNLPALHYNQVDIEGRPAPQPQRTEVRTDIAAIAGSVQLFKEAITDTMGVPPSALGHVDPTLKSGKAINAILQQADRGTSNYLDNLVRSMRHEARVVNDLLYPIYGRPGRIARMMNMQGEMETVMLHQPFVMQGGKPMPAQDGQPDAQKFTLTKDADFNVAVKVSKNFDTRRQQEAETLGQIIAADPQQMQIVGDLFFKYQDGPGHEEMAERYKAVLAPPVQALLNKGQQSPELQQATAKIQQLEQQLQQAAQFIKSKQVEEQAKQQAATQREMAKTQMEQQGDAQQAQIDAAVTIKKAEIDAQTRIAVARINAQAGLTEASIKAGLEHTGHQVARDEQLIGNDHELRVQAIDHEHEAQQAERSAVNAAGQMAAQQAHDAEMSERSAQEAAE